MIKENRALTSSKNRTSPTTAMADVNTSLGNMGMEALVEVFQAQLKYIAESKDMSTKEKIDAVDKSGLRFVLGLVLFCEIIKRIQ